MTERRSGTPRPDPLDDLVDGVRRGEPGAVAAVYLEVAPALRGFLRRRVPHGEVADDLVEQTFLELIETGHRIRGDGAALRAWLYRAARNDLADWRRRADRRADRPLPEADGPSDGLDVAETALASSLDPTLEAALAELTGAQREVIELRVVAGLPLVEVAALTGRSVGAVKLLQHRALRRLAARLSPPPASDGR